MNRNQLDDIVRLGEILVSKAKVTFQSPFLDPSPLDILESIAEPQHSHHCRKCRHDFTLITEDDGDRILPMFCPMCLSREVEKYCE